MFRRLKLPSQERIESSDVGRAVISAFLIVTVISVVAVNMPSESRLRREVLKIAQPYLNAAGLDQTWSVFAPDPRRTSVELYGRVRYRDGTVGIWRVPRGGAVFGEYWDYRWRKWYENVVQDVRARELWRPAATFIARQERDRGRQPARVTLVRRLSQLRPPATPGPDRTRFREQAYYSLKVTPAVLGED